MADEQVNTNQESTAQANLAAEQADEQVNTTTSAAAVPSPGSTDPDEQPPVTANPAVRAPLPPAPTGAPTLGGINYNPHQAENSVTFHLNDLIVRHRTFSQEDHGENWRDVAQEFFNTHQNKVLSIVYS